MSDRADLQLLRETLEKSLSYTVATSVLFDALAEWDRGIPATRAELSELVRGPLASQLARRIGKPRAATLIARLEANLEPVPSSVEVEIDIDLAQPPEGARTAQMRAVPHPVSVLVLAPSGDFARRIEHAIGLERVDVQSVGTVGELRKASFSSSPLLVVVDAASCGGLSASDLTSALTGLPDASIPVVWGTDCEIGRELAQRLSGPRARTVLIAGAEGIAPLCDLVLSRFQKLASAPPRS